MKRVSIAFLSLLLIFGTVLLPCRAEEKKTGFHWYCPHVAGHLQPRTGGELAFAESFGAYYVDRAHKAWDAADKVIYLTFDAGYENGNVAKVLDTLKEENVPGAFFILGGLIRNSPDLVKRMAAEGHTVCNHTVRHKNMCAFGDDEFLAELRELEKKYTDLTGEPLAAYYRPPEGAFSEANLACAQKNGYKTVFWSFAYPDWNNDRQPDPARAKQMILDNLHNGEVMLLHPTSATNAAILGDVIREIKALGFRFGTLDELTAERDG